MGKNKHRIKLILINKLENSGNDFFVARITTMQRNVIKVILMINILNHLFFFLLSWIKPINLSSSLSLICMDLLSINVATASVTEP